MILHDPYALHRQWWNPNWNPGPNDTDWTVEDYILADVYQVIEDYTDPQSGQWMPFDQSGDVWWNVKSKYSGAQAAIDKERESRKELKPGESLYAVPVFKDEDNKPTLNSWFDDLENDSADNRPSSARESRPPTAEEMAAIRSAVN